MATKKKAPEKSLWEMLEKTHNETKELPLLATRCYVVEVTDAYDNSDDRYISGSSRAVSGYFDSRKVDDPRAEAEKWISEHDPDSFVAGGARPNYFQIHEEFLRTHTENKWGPL